MWLKVKEWLWDVKFHTFGFEIPLLYLVIIILLVIGYQVIRGRFNEGKWETLRSEELGYKIDYPAGWSAETFFEGYENKHRGLPEGTRAFINHEFFIPINKKTALLYWLPESSLDEALRWGNETLEVDRKSVALQEVQVGIGLYPALTRSYRIEAGTRKIVYIPTNNGVFLLEFLARNYNEKVEAIFEHMLASFEVTS